MVQGVTPRQALVIPDLETAGLETSRRATRDHFMSAPTARRGSPPWSNGIYLGTFVILSVSDTQDELACTARGAFDSAAVRVLLNDYVDVVCSAVATPSQRLSELIRPTAIPTKPDDSVDLDRFRADTLRTSLWSTMPGYAWPASVTTASDGSLTSGDGIAEPPPFGDGARPLASTADVTLLGALWAEVLGIDRCRPDDKLLAGLLVSRGAGGGSRRGHPHTCGTRHQKPDVADARHGAGRDARRSQRLADVQVSIPRR